MPTTLERIQAIIADKFGEDEGKSATLATDFVRDLQADSLDLVELIMAIEEEFKVGGITDEEAEKITTIQATVEFLKARGVKD